MKRLLIIVAILIALIGCNNYTKVNTDTNECEAIDITDNATAGITSVIYDNIPANIHIKKNDVDIVESHTVVDGASFEIPSDNECGYDTLYAMTRVNVRKEPNDQSEIIRTLKTGESIEIYGKIGNDIWSWNIDPNTGERAYICDVFLCWEEPVGNDYTNEELDLLARLVYSENGCLGYRAMLYTGSVVLNRIASSRFPDTLYDVIYQDGQYEVTWNGGINKKPTDEAYDVAEELLKYGSVLPSNVIWQAEFEQGDGVYTEIGPTKFCYSNNY